MASLARAGLPGASLRVTGIWAVSLLQLRGKKAIRRGL